MRLGSVLVAAVIGYFLFDMIRDLASPRKVSVYPIACTGKVGGHLCEGKLGAPLTHHRSWLSPTVKKVIAYSDGTVTRLKGCVVPHGPSEAVEPARGG